MPKFQLKVPDMSQAVSLIKGDIKDRLLSFFDKIDHSFALENYDYVLNSHQNNYIASVYK